MEPIDCNSFINTLKKRWPSLLIHPFNDRYEWIYLHNLLRVSLRKEEARPLLNTINYILGSPDEFRMSIIKKRYDIDRCLDQFISTPTKRNQTAVIDIFKVEKQEMFSLLECDDDFVYKRTGTIRDTVKYINALEFDFKKMMKRITRRFIDVCIALRPLHLSSYVFLFILQQLNEFDQQLPAYQLMRIIESISKN